MPPRVVPAHIQQDLDVALFVHRSKGPHSLVVTPKLNGSNCLAWSRSMPRALGKKCKLGFINVKFLHRCEATRVAKNHRNEDQIMQFLTGLNDQFSLVKTLILLLDPLPYF